MASLLTGVLAAGGGAVVAAAPPAAATTAVPSPRHDVGPCGGRQAHRVMPGDTWFDVARAAGVPLRSLLAENSADEDSVIRPGDDLCLPAGAAATSSSRDGRCSVAQHTVASGDSWFSIARGAGVRVARLLEANGADSGRVLHPGEVVCLPSGASAAPATPSWSGALDALPLHGPCWYGDTWHAPRGGGRRHEGVDLLARTGQYVYAVTDGTLTKRAWDQPGLRSGNAWWLTAADGSGTYYFYAHLSDFAPGLGVGDRVEAGEIIGFVGNTGNSSFPHLHFEIHPNGGGAINPYATVKALGGCKSGTGYRQPSGWTPNPG